MKEQLEVRKDEKTGLYSFVYEAKGLFFPTPSHYAMVDRVTGMTHIGPLEELEDSLPPKGYQHVRARMSLSNEFINDKFHIVGLERANG